MSLQKIEPKPIVTKFCIIYDGENHKDHEINILTLGNALTALGNLIYTTNEVINGDSRPIEVKVSGDLIEGSIGLEIMIQTLENSKDVLMYLGFLGSAALAGSVVAVIEWLKGDDITFIENLEKGISRIVVNERETRCPEVIAKLVSNSKIRRSLEELIKDPLKIEGTDVFIVKKNRSDTENVLKIDKKLSQSFTRLKIEETMEEDNFNSIVKFIAANVKSSSGWKVEINGKEELVKMEDAIFRERLTNMKEPHIFGKNFNVELQKITKTKFGSEKHSFIIKKVRHESI